MGKGVLWVTVQRTEEHIIALIEYILRAVSVMEIHIQDGHPLRATIEQILGRNRSIIEKTVSAEHIPRRMMSRRATQGKNSGLP